MVSQTYCLTHAPYIMKPAVMSACFDIPDRSFAVPPQGSPTQLCMLNTEQPREHHHEHHRHRILLYLLQRISGRMQQNILMKGCLFLIHTKVPYGLAVIPGKKKKGRWLSGRETLKRGQQ